MIDPIDKTAFKRLFALLRPHWRRLLLAAFCMLGTSGATAATAYLIKPAMDDIFIQKNLTMLQLIPAVFLLVALINALCQWGNDYYLKSVGLSIVAHLREQLYNHIQDMPLAFFDRNSTGVLMSRITNDVNEIQNAVTRGFTGLIRDSLSVVGLIFVVFYQDWKLAAIAILVMPLAIYPLFKFGSKLRKLATKGQETMAQMSTILHETFTGVRIVKAFVMEDYEKARFAERNQKVLHYFLKSEWIDSLSSPLMEFVGAFAVAIVIGYGGYQVIQGASTPGTLFSFLGALLMLYRPIKSLSKANTVVQKGIASNLRIYDILNEKNHMEESPEAVEAPDIQGAIEFKHVFFAYDEKMVLKDIHVSVPAGELIALAGSSGGGKTTLVNLIPRFYDVTRGAILVDGINIRSLKIRSLREKIAIVTQQSFLFNDTVRNNIAYGSLRRADEDIVWAARAAYAYDFIMQLPQGFDTIIGEQGVRLSGGQRQRLCIARAILKDAPILILDEATSSLDSESELEVQMALENLMAGRTTFVIAHRLSTIQNADRILVIADGRIVEQGTHDSLLSQDGEYRRLFDIQFMKSGQ